MKSVDENRVNWIDFCRGGGMLLVLLGHTAFPFRSFVYGFHMPLFFVVSGLVYHEAKVCPFVKYAKIIYKINLLTATCLGLIGFMSIFLNPGVEFNNNTYGNLFLMLFGAVGVCILAVKISSLIGNSNGKIFSYIQWIGKIRFSF